VLACAGLLLSFAYVGSFKAVYGTSYGAMVATKALLFGLLLFLGALNFQLVRRGPASSILASLKRFGEAEIGIGITVILTAASLTSLPPAADLTHDRVTGQEIFARMSPRSPRFASPSVQELPEEIYAAQKKAFESGSLSTESYVPGQTGTRPNTPAEKAWSEYNHHWAGLIVLIAGLLALFSRRRTMRWARFWPLSFAGLAVFILLRADPENWPLGPRPFWQSFAAPDVLQHRIGALLIVVFAAFECAVQAGKLRARWATYVFPAMCALGAALLLTHEHSAGPMRSIGGAHWTARERLLSMCPNDARGARRAPPGRTEGGRWARDRRWRFRGCDTPRPSRWGRGSATCCSPRG